jgi:hypothetical protein
MASPSPEAIALIRARVADWSPGDAAIAADLNGPAADNPSPQGQTPRPFTAIDLLGAIDPTRRAAVKPLLGPIRPDLDAQDARAIVGWAESLLLIGDLQQADVDALIAVVTATEPDPAWTARLSWAQADLGRPADAEDVAASRPGA